METQDVLENMGFSKKEIAVYLALLRLGSSPVTKIAKESKTYRTYTYDILEELVKKGVVSSFIKKGTRIFETTEPEKLLHILEEKEQQVRNILPDLNSLRGTAITKPDLEFYEGREGIKTLMDSIITQSPKELLVIANTKQQKESMSFYFDQYIKNKTANKIKSRVLSEKSTYAKKNIKKKDKKELRETRFLPEKINEPVVKYLYNDTVIIISFEPHIIGMRFTSKTIASYEQKIFEILWSQAAHN